MVQDSPYGSHLQSIRKKEKRKINSLIGALFFDLSSDQDVKDATTRERLEEFVDSRIRKCASVMSTTHGWRYETIIESYIPSSKDTAYATVKGQAKEFLWKYVAKSI